MFFKIEKDGSTSMPHNKRFVPCCFLHSLTLMSLTNTLYLNEEYYQLYILFILPVYRILKWCVLMKLFTTTPCKIAHFFLIFFINGSESIRVSVYWVLDSVPWLGGFPQPPAVTPLSQASWYIVTLQFFLFWNEHLGCYRVSLKRWGSDRSH